jgi:hypothetical protein
MTVHIAQTTFFQSVEIIGIYHTVEGAERGLAHAKANWDEFQSKRDPSTFDPTEDRYRKWFVEPREVED